MCTYSGDEAVETNFRGLPGFFFNGGLPFFLGGVSTGTLLWTTEVETIGETADSVKREAKAFSHAAVTNNIYLVKYAAS